ncbi:hypothetical protein [Paenibacillus lentus]|nr:hypothetical protein [Paenibacillus lentus]
MAIRSMIYQSSAGIKSIPESEAEEFSNYVEYSRILVLVDPHWKKESLP